MTHSMFLTNFCSILIACINHAITVGIVKVMNEVGLSTQSRRSASIAQGVFVLQFLNTGVILLLITANFKEQGIDPYGWFNGSRTDFGMLWYSQTGDLIVKTMIITNLILPIIVEVFFGLLRKVYRLRDRGWKSNPKNKTTKCISEQQYINLHAGPTF